MNAFINVTDLTLVENMIIKDCGFYFSNVTHLTLTRPEQSLWELDIPESERIRIVDFRSSTPLKFKSLTKEHVEHLKMIVNLSNLQYLDISKHDLAPISSSIFLEIIQQTPRLCYLKTDWNQLISFLEDNELCNYLNKMIKRLIVNHSQNTEIKDAFNGEKFCQVFSNIEHLDCREVYAEKLVFLLNQLPKISIVNLHWVSKRYPTKSLDELEYTVRRKNMNDVHVKRVKFNFDNDDDNVDPSSISYYITMCLWFD